MACRRSGFDPCSELVDQLNTRFLHDLWGFLPIKKLLGIRERNDRARNRERGSSAVERRTHNQERPGSNPPFLPYQTLGIFVLSMTPDISLRCINVYLAIKSDGGGNVIEVVVARNWCMARMLPREAELVSE